MDSDEIKTSNVGNFSLLKAECGPYFIPHLVVMKVFISFFHLEWDTQEHSDEFVYEPVWTILWINSHEFEYKKSGSEQVQSNSLIYGGNYFEYKCY